MTDTATHHPIRAVAWRLTKAWAALLIALIPAVIAGATGFFLYAVISGPQDGLQHHFTVPDMLGNWLLVCVLSLPLILGFAVLGAPLIPLQRWIVGPRFPFLRLGYLGVAAYGPLLLAVAYRSGGEGLPLWCALYEVVALVATALFIPMAKRFHALSAS